MHARESLFSSPLFGDDIKKILPIIDERGSDSAMFDNVLEMLVLTGRSLPHAVMMMIPEPWSGHESMSAEKKAFYEYHASPDGAVGRPGLDRLHRRHPHRRRPRPQRPAALALLRHQGRPGRHGLRGRRARHPAGARAAQGPPAAGPHVPGRHRGRPHHRRRGDQAPHRHREALRRSGCATTWSRWRSCRRRRRRPSPTTRRCCKRQQAFGYTREDLEHAHAAHGQGRQRGRRLHGQRHAAGRALGAAAAALQLLQAALRPGHQPAGRRHPRRDHHGRRTPPSAPSATCSSRRRSRARQIKLADARSSPTRSWRSSAT